MVQQNCKTPPRHLHFANRRITSYNVCYTKLLRADRAAGDDEAEGVDRIAGVRRQDDVAGAGDRLGQVGQALLGAQGDDDLPLRVEIDVEASYNFV